MSKISVIFGLAAVCLLPAAGAAAPDFRPKFDKSDYVGTIGTQVNPWFPVNKEAGDYGGPNVAWKHYTGKDLWAQGMRETIPYGLSTWLPEINEPTGYIVAWKEMLRQAVTNRVPIRLGLFYGLYSKGTDATLAALKKQLLPIVGTLTNSPYIARAGGRPVMQIYNPLKLKPAEWGPFLARIDAEICPMTYFLDAPTMACKAGRVPGPYDEKKAEPRYEKLVRDYIPYFDGLSGYANGCSMFRAATRRVMDDYPQKIYEGLVHQTYTVHFHMGGGDVRLSRNWRNSVDGCLATDPDAVMLTNFFDHYENSLVFPCYDREDFLLRYLECQAAKMRKKPFRRLWSAELVVTGNYVAQLGVTPLEFEVIGFPTKSNNKTVVLRLDLCDASGKVLYTFPDRRMTLGDKASVETFVASTLDYAGERGIVARLRYQFDGHWQTMNYCPMTVLDPSLRGYRMYWARSTKNELATREVGPWMIDGVGPGGTHAPRTAGMSMICGKGAPFWQHWEKWRNGQSRFLLRRDGEEYYARNEVERGFGGTRRIALPPSGGALHWYNLEMENGEGRKYMTLPIWETDGSRRGKVTTNVPNGTNGVATVEVEEARVPFWDYPMTEDGGKMLIDASGWEHHGALGGKGFGGGHLGHTGYNHQHTGIVGSYTPGKSSMLRRASDGSGYLAFNGSNDYVMVMGGTAFPGASTYELKVRPAAFGRDMGLIGSGNGQISIDLLKDGLVRASRKTKAGTKSVVTKEKLPLGVWTQLAVVYDLKTLTLYVNGEAAGSVDAPWMSGLDFYNNLTIGSRCHHPYNPAVFFRGDIGHVRITGRNLSKDELLP